MTSHETLFTDAKTLKYVDEVSSVTVMKAAGPVLLGFILLEGLISIFRRSKSHRLNDTINSMSHGMFENLPTKITGKTLEFGVYCYIYAHWAPFHFEENLWTGILAFLGVDLGYYWFHRMAHEINLFWATHSVHHSSEEYNLSTAMRQSSVQAYCSWMFYLPLAFVVPPRLFYLHLQINLIYQFWIHTKMLGNLGPLEWVLNTPSHHRVHHGRNPRYLDKNYGGVLIIYDRLFGTFQAEDEDVAFGLVHPSQSFNLLEGQFAHFKWIWQRLGEENGLWNKWAVLWKGPGWHSGTERLGDPSEIPAIDPLHQKYDPKLPPYHAWYLAANFFCISAFSVFISLGLMNVPIHHSLYLLMFAFSLQSLSLLSDRSPWAPYLELLRTTLFLLADILCAKVFMEPSQYRFLWYTDLMKSPSVTSSNAFTTTGIEFGEPSTMSTMTTSFTPQFSPYSIGFVILRCLTLGSWLFMLHHVLVERGLLKIPLRWFSHQLQDKATKLASPLTSSPRIRLNGTIHSKGSPHTNGNLKSMSPGKLINNRHVRRG